MRRVSMNAIVPTTPIAADTDVDTSIDLDKSEGALQGSKKTNLTRTVFEVTVKELESRQNDNESSTYEKHLRQEIKDWKDYVTKALADLKKAKASSSVVDCSVLSKEKREFIEQAPDLTRFLLRMKEFRGLALKFIENDHAEIVTLRQNLDDLVARRLNSRKEHFIAEQCDNYD